MRGKKRTKEERHELFSAIQHHLGMGFSLKKACALSGIPYSTMRDIVRIYEPLRASTTALQNQVNVTARQNIINAITDGDIAMSKWWLERMDYMEPIVVAGMGTKHEILNNTLDPQETDIEFLKEIIVNEKVS